ncbi:MAG: gluconate 2-dehydrogenase subunit 3 family protein, partial [Actinomycetospora chiangmaiensis]|nr:gluconate 2-dehydrogenase subunit 3 family protein [Actinomycetospora chiangmaiensis]
MLPRRDLYPGYDVLAKRDSPSWNAKTRAVLDERLAIGPETRRFLDATEWPTMKALADRIVPQPADRVDPVPVAALVDHKLATDTRDGYRNPELPEERAAWRLGL